MPTRRFGHDIFFLLDNGWRVVNGQRPHVDFYSPWGPLTYLIVGLGMRVSHYSVNSVGYGSAIFGLLVGLWSYHLGRDRMESSLRILLSLFLTALVMAPYVLGTSPMASSHAMVYNRYGYALLGLIMLEGFQPVRGGTRRKEELIGGISSGAAAALLLFLKVSFFLVSLPLIGVSVLFWCRARSRLLGLASGFLLVSLGFLGYLHFDIQAVFRDLRMVAGARAESLHVWVVVSDAARNGTRLLTAILLVLTCSLWAEAARQPWRGLQLALFAAAACVADVLLLFTNMQGDAFPLTAVFAIIAVSTVTTRDRQLPDSQARVVFPYYTGVLFLASLLILPQLGSDLSGLVYGAWSKTRPTSTASVVHFTEPCLASLLLYDSAQDSVSNGTIYTTYVNDGVALLRRSSRSDQTVITMDMMNPFSYALQRKPALGGIAAAAYNYTLSDEYRPTDDGYFGNADIVMVPKRPAVEPILHDPIIRIYEPALEKRYRLEAESDWWRLYKHK